MREKEITIRLVREKGEIIIIRQAYLVQFKLNRTFRVDKSIEFTAQEKVLKKQDPLSYKLIEEKIRKIKKEERVKVVKKVGIG